jgi:hypothetical protein
MKSQQESHPNPEVEYWMRRAIKAEKELDDERRRSIATHPEIDRSYKNLFNRIFGGGSTELAAIARCTAARVKH